MRPRVLVIDDSFVALRFVTDVLNRAGFEVIAEKNGPDGLMTFQAQEPDLVILDINMPGMDGLETCRRIRELEGGQEVPILFLTDDKSADTQEQAIQVGGDDLVIKDTLKRELAIRVRANLRVRRLQQALKSERDDLREAKYQRDMLTRFIVHDFKSPLQTILLSADLMEERVRNGGEWEVLMGRIREAGHTMTRMVQDLLDVSNSEAGELRLRVESFRLEDLVADCARNMQELLVQKNQALAQELPSGALWRGDVDLLRRCLLNILGNASKYGPRGEPIELAMQVLEDALRVRVMDRGPGVPQHMKKRIFDPFFRLDRDASQARISNGLGLAFCRTAVKAHKGRIWVEDNPKGGAVFCLELPSLLDLGCA